VVKLAIGLAIGWVVGSRALDADFSDVVDALRAVARSEELRDLVHTVRWHASQTLRDMADMLDVAQPAPHASEVADEDLVARVTDLQTHLAH
jgi:hypothetical protein